MQNRFNLTLIFTIAILLFYFNSYSQSIPKNIKIIAKYNILNISKPPYMFSYCHGKIKPFKKTNKHHCAFLLSEHQITLKTKYLLDDKGKIKEYWSYKPEGILTSTIEEIKEDTILYPILKRIKIDIIKNNLVDTGKKVQIIEVFKDEKLILGNLNLQKVLYQYK